MANPFKKIKNAMQLMKSVDLKQLDALSQKIDLSKMLDKFSQLDDQQMKALVKMLDSSDKERALPEINGDFYETHLHLKPEHRKIQLQVREFMEKEVQPLRSEERRVGKEWRKQKEKDQNRKMKKKLNMEGTE